MVAKLDCSLDYNNRTCIIVIMDHEPATKCPQCDSEDVRMEKISARSMAISVLLLGFPLPSQKRRYSCFDCSSHFKLNYESDVRLRRTVRVLIVCLILIFTLLILM